MMNKQMTAVVLTVSVVAGVATGVVANALTDRGTVTASPTASSAPTNEGGEPGTVAPDDLTLAPGAVGPIKAGMSKAQALRTGYFVADVAAPVDGCPARPLMWKDKYVNTFDVQTLGNGEITSIGIRGDSVKTAGGVGVGSTYDEVLAQYPDATLVDAGYSQSGISEFDAQDGGWIGFLFDAEPKAVTGKDPVTFVEVTKGGQPSLMRDGC